MKKALSVFSIISLSICGAAFLLGFSFLTFLWEPMCVQYTDMQEIAATGPVLPIANVIQFFFVSLAAILLTSTSKIKGRTISIEIILAILLSIISPLLTYFISVFQNVITGNRLGTVYLAKLSITSNILIFPAMMLGIASSICLIVCGMRIACKKAAKEQNSTIGNNQIPFAR